MGVGFKWLDGDFGRKSERTMYYWATPCVVRKRSVLGAFLKLEQDPPDQSEVNIRGLLFGM